MCAGRVPVMIDEAYIVPLVFGARTFGGMFVYVTAAEPRPTVEERAYWKTAAMITSVYLAWQAGEKQAVDSRRAQTARMPLRAPTQSKDDSI